MTYDNYKQKNFQTLQNIEEIKVDKSIPKEVDNEENDILKNFQITNHMLEKFTKHPDLIIPSERMFKQEVNLSPNLLKPRAIKKGEPQKFNDN